MVKLATNTFVADIYKYDLPHWKHVYHSMVELGWPFGLISLVAVLFLPSLSWRSRLK